MEQSAADDVTLLGLIAQHRDAAAFSSLYARYKAAGYSLALNIAGDPGLAEEALQEGMTRVWSSAGKFRADLPGGGNVKAWIMKIIARESMKAMQARKRRRREVPQDIDLPAPQANESKADSNELIDALQRKLLDLTETDRRCLALHFGGGMSQSEVGEAMDMPQQTVSHRIQRALKTLRDELAASGFAVVPVLNSEMIEAAMSSGHAPPPGMSGRIKAQISKRGRQIAQKNPGMGVGSLVAAVVVVAGVGAALWLNSRPTPALSPLPSASLAPVAAKLTSPMRWTFEKEPGPDLLLGKGAWNWLADKKAMETGDCVFSVLPVRIPATPSVFGAVTTIAPNASRLAYGLLLHREDTTMKISKNWRRRTTNVAKGSDHKAYFTGRHMIEFLNGMPVRVIEYEEEVAGAQIMVLANNLQLYSLEWNPAPGGELPPDLNDIAKLTKDMTRIDSMTREEMEKFDKE